MSGGAFDYRDDALNYLQGMVAKEIGYLEYCAMIVSMSIIQRHLSI